MSREPWWVALIANVACTIILIGIGGAFTWLILLTDVMFDIHRAPIYIRAMGYLSVAIIWLRVAMGIYGLFLEFPIARQQRDEVLSGGRNSK